MTTQTEVLKLALEAIHDLEGEINGYRSSDFPIPEKAKAFLRQAIEEAQEKEPCTRVECMGSNGCIGYCWSKKKQRPVGEVVLYTGDGFPCAPFLQVKWADGRMPDEGTQLFIEEQP